MAAPLDAVESPRAQTSRSKQRTWPTSARSTTCAYGSPAGVIASALGEIPRRTIRGYGIRVDGELASVASIIDVDDDAFVTMVATLPHRRGNRLASKPARPSAPRGKATRQDHHLPAGLEARPEHLRPPRLPRARRGPPLREAARSEPQPRARGSQVLPALRATGDRRLPPLDQLPALRLRRLLQPEAGGGGDPGHAPSNEIILLQAEASTPARTCGRSPAASWTSANRLSRRRAEKRRRSSRSTSSSRELVGVYSRPEDRVVLIVFAATTTETPSTTPEATEVEAFKPDEIPWQELAFWSTTNALKDFLARS